jgi:hypothetical protein
VPQELRSHILWHTVRVPVQNCLQQTPPFFNIRELFHVRSQEFRQFKDLMECRISVLRRFKCANCFVIVAANQGFKALPFLSFCDANCKLWIRSIEPGYSLTVSIICELTGLLTALAAVTIFCTLHISRSQSGLDLRLIIILCIVIEFCRERGVDDLRKKLLCHQCLGVIS